MASAGMSWSDAAGWSRSAGRRVTAAQQPVLGWLAEHPHSRAEAIKRGAGERTGSVSHQAVYDVWAVGVGAGLVRRIEPAGHPALFERRGFGDTTTTGLPWLRSHRRRRPRRGYRAMPDRSRTTNPQFAADEAEIRFWGLCPACTV